MSAAAAVRVRPASRADVPALRRLRAQVNALHARLLPDFFRLEEDVPGMVVERDPYAEILVAEAEQEIRGYIVVNVVDTPSDPAMTKRRRAHVEVIVVDEAYRRCGIGARLMRDAATWAGGRGAVETVLTVWTDNREAEGFYRALGYEPIARVLRRSIDGI
ncbi:MAG TPA: GNAT family N-acetyltransferase [Polyangia bacterium]